MKFKIDGPQVPKGQIKVSGAKNAATRLLAAAAISNESVELLNFPTHLVDVKKKASFLRSLGVQVELDHDLEKALINPINASIAEQLFVETDIRTTYLLAACQLKATGRAKIPYPGGCRIGSRGYDLHVMVWQGLGCRVDERDEYIEIDGTDLKAGEINFPYFTVGGTENALITASIISGITTIKNAYISPEVRDLIAFLRRIGVEIQLQGNSFIQVTGRKVLRGSRFHVMPDRIEALTWIIYSLLSRGDVVVDEVPFDDLQIPLMHLKETGIDLFVNSKSAYITPSCLRSNGIQPFELACGTHPGVISDMQPFFVLLGLFADGVSLIHDYRYPDRTAYLQELVKFCPGSIEWKSGKIQMRGNVPFKAASAESTDLRGSMAVVLAALLADGQSEINNIEMALRGYNNLASKLDSLGIKYQLSE